MGKDMEILNQALAAHKPYAIIVADSTGGDPKQGAELFRAELRVYDYNAETNQYEMTDSFSDMIKTSAEEMKKINFAKHGIDKEDYLKSAVIPSKFAKDLQRFLMEELGVGEKDTALPLFIGSGNEGVCMELLEKTDGSAIPFKDNNIEILSATNILKDFLEENGSKGQSNLTLHRFLNPDGSRPDNTADGKFALYQQMIERHCENHGFLAEQTAEKAEPVQIEEPENDSPEAAQLEFPEVSQPELPETPASNFFDLSEEAAEIDLDKLFKQVQQTTLDEPEVPKEAPEQQTAPQTPPVMKPPEGIRFFSEEEEKRIAEFEERSRQEEEAQKAAWSAKGKEDFASGDTAKKLGTMGRMYENGKKLLDEEAVLDSSSDCAYNRFCQIANGTYREEPEGTVTPANLTLQSNKGFTVVHVGTTGFKATGIEPDDSKEQKANKKGGSPMQIYLATFEPNEDGTLEQITHIHFYVQADEKALQEAIRQADSGGFDTFRHGGTNREEYLALCQEGRSDENKKFCTQEAAVNTIRSYMQFCPPQEYPLVTASPTTLKSLKTLRGIENIGNLAVFDNPIDFNQVIREYALVALKVPEYHEKNMLFPNGETPQNYENFKLATLASHWGKEIAGALATGEFVASLAQNIHQHENEANREHIAALEKQAEEQKTPLPVQEEQPERKPEERQNEQPEREYHEDTIEPIQPESEVPFMTQPIEEEPKIVSPPENEVPFRTPTVEEQKTAAPVQENPAIQTPEEFFQQANALKQNLQAQAQQLQAQQAGMQAAVQQMAQPQSVSSPDKFDQMIQLLSVIAVNGSAATQGISDLTQRITALEQQVAGFQQAYIDMGKISLQNQMQTNGLLQQTVENGVQQIQQGSQAISIQTQNLQQAVEINENQKAANQKSEQVLAEVRENSADTRELAVGLKQLFSDSLELRQSDNEIRKDVTTLAGAVEQNSQSIGDVTQKVVNMDVEGKETRVALEETAQLAKETKAEVAEHASSITELKAFRKTTEAKLERYGSAISELQNNANELDKKCEALEEKRKTTDKALAQVATALGEEEGRISETRLLLKNVLEEGQETREIVGGIKGQVDTLTQVVIQDNERLNQHEDILMGESKEIKHTPEKIDRAG